MKKITLLLAVFCLIAFNAVAQTQLEKGKLMLGVTSTMSMCGSWGSEALSLNITKTKYKHDSSTEDAYNKTAYNILPKVGYFIIDNLVAGLEAVISGEKGKYIDDGDTWKESVFGIGPFVRYYYPLEKFYPFAEVETMFGSYKDTDWDGDDKEAMFMFGGGLGAAMPLGDRVTFDALIGYSRVRWSWEAYEGEGTDKQIDGGLLIKAGFSIYLR